MKSAYCNVLLSAVVGVAAMALVRSSEPDFARHFRKPGEDVKYVAHQGEEHLAVNHSIAAYRIAAEHKCDSLKLDVRQTKDGVIVTQHDKEIRAIYRTNLVISATTHDVPKQFTRSKGEFPDQHMNTGDRGDKATYATLEGKGGHSSAPWKCEDLVTRLSAAIVKIHDEWYRRHPLAQDADHWSDVLTPTVVKSEGTALNRIPSEVWGMPSEAWLNYRDERNSNHIRNQE